MRDAQSLLDQLLAFGGERLTIDQVHHLLGTADDDRVIALASAVVEKDSPRVLALLDEAATTGLQLGELVDQLISYWRDLMVVACGGTQGRELSVPARHHETLQRHAQAISLDTILAGLDILSTTKARMRGSSHARTLIEMALVRLSRLHDLVSLSQMAQWLRGLPPPGPATAGGNAAGGPVRPAALPEMVKKKSLSPGAEAPSPALSPVAANLTEATLPVLWPQILSVVGPLMGTEVGRAGLPAISGPNALVLRFPPAYNQAREFTQSPDRLARLEEAIRKLTGKPWVIQVEALPGNSPAPASAESGVGLSEGTGKNGNSGSGDGQGRARRNPKEEVADRVPLIKRALDVLDATIRNVDEGFGTGTSPADRAASPAQQARWEGTLAEQSEEEE
jgi:DNA polymerase-3 subunit gamma/tau